MQSGRLGPFANGYWGNPSYKLPPEGNLVIVSHYLDALQVSKIGAQMMAILGGKNPHPQTLVVGGVTSVMDALEAQRLGRYLFRLKEMKNLIETAYILTCCSPPLITWCFILFVIVHIYMAFWYDAVLQKGTVSSMICGRLFEKVKEE